uniref:protein LURP-one-related 6 n=1 Tax=Erigeron canadensis TaxID=72917 RepID=UPI001CB8F979|nr:protein LURP-one-related 6 [Erigeron canadensis]
MMGSKVKEMPVVSKMFCSSSQVVLGVRNRPHVVGGGGFVVSDMHSHQVMFRVDGCGVLGKKDQMTLKDAYQTPLLLIRRKGGIVEALSLQKQWGGYTSDFAAGGGSSHDHHQNIYNKLVFTLKDPQSSAPSSCISKRRPIVVVAAVSSSQKDNNNNDENIIYFQIKGYFPDRDCSIVDSGGNIIAQVGVDKEMMEKKDVYHVVVKSGIDQAFVVGVIAILDYIHNGSTRC